MKQYAIFFHEEYLGAAPTVINLAQMLAEQDSWVTIYTLKPDLSAVQPGKLSDNIQIVHLASLPFLYSSVGLKYLRWMKLRSLASVLELILFTAQTLSHLSWACLTSKAEARINIGVDVFGLNVAWLARLFLKQKYLFLSLELKPPKQILGKFSQLLNLFIQEAYSKAEAVLIQDADRFSTLSQDYQSLQSKVFYLPNSPLPVESIDDAESPDDASANYFRKKFNLDSATFPIIVLHAGMITGHVLLDKLARAFVDIDSGTAFVIHSGLHIVGTEPYIASLQEINSKNLFLSLNPVPYDQVDRIYAAATIGLAFYEMLDSDHTEAANFAQIAKASGKLAHLLKQGKPVLVSNLPSLVELINCYSCGIVINDPSNAEEIKRAIQQIMLNYSTYSQNAKDCFISEFDFRVKAQPVLHFMDQLTESAKFKAAHT